MTKTVLQKSKNKPLSEQVRKAMKKYFATLGDAAPANIYEMVMTEVEPELLKAVMPYLPVWASFLQCSGNSSAPGSLCTSMASSP